MELSTTEAVKLMRKLNLELVECKHHVRGFVVVNGKRMFPVHCSFGRKALPGHVPHKFMKSLQLNEAEFATLRACKIGPQQYAAILNSKGIT